jgi:hypothetical protein
MQAQRHGRIVNVSTEMASLSGLATDPYGNCRKGNRTKNFRR